MPLDNSSPLIRRNPLQVHACILILDLLVLPNDSSGISPFPNPMPGKKDSV